MGPVVVRTHLAEHMEKVDRAANEPVCDAWPVLDEISETPSALDFEHDVTPREINAQIAELEVGVTTDRQAIVSALALGRNEPSVTYPPGKLCYPSARLLSAPTRHTKRSCTT